MCECAILLGFDPDIPNLAERPTPKAVNGNLLLWPLYGAGETGMASDIMRNWVIRRLLYIADIMGTRQAAPLAATLSSKQDIVEWKADYEMLEYTPAETDMSLEQSLLISDEGVDMGSTGSFHLDPRLLFETDDGLSFT